MSKFTIYHNPRCSKSRETLALLEKEQLKIRVIKYLETPPDSATLQQIIDLLGFDSARQLMRTKEKIYKELALQDEKDEATLLRAMVENPKLIERPIVVKGDRAVLGRPPENVLALLD